MKILFISSGILPVPAFRGGAVENLTQMLIENKEINQNNDITVFTINDVKISKFPCCNGYDLKIIDNKTLIYKFLRGIRHLINKNNYFYVGNQYISSVVKMINKEKIKYDVIIVENSPEYGIILKKHIKNTKLILHLHNDYLNINTKFADKILNVYDEIFTISNYLKSRVLEIDSIATAKTNVLYNGIDLFKFSNKSNKLALRKKYNFNKNDLIFMFSGRLVPEKGIKELIQAFNNNNLASNIKLIVVGKESSKHRNYYNELMLLIEKNRENIRFMGYVEYEKIPEMYIMSDINVIPSKWDEPFGLTVVEGLACGNPVITSDMGAIPEIVNKDAGIIVKKDESFVRNISQAILKYVEMDEQLLNGMRKSARKNAELFSKEEYINNFIKLLGKV